MMKHLFLFTAGLLWCLQTQAQLKSPEEFLGYNLGERFTPHHRVMAYFEHVAAQMAHISLTPYGETNEYRPLLTAFVASPDNFNKLEEIRQNHMAHTGLTSGAAAANDDIAIVWLSYNVHGNESVSTEASMRVLYELANPNNKQTQQWLNNTVVIIDPCLNPDGRERYVQWYQQKAASPYNPSPDAWEHHEPWPGGRMNHYMFDLNRDWAWATQKETQARLALYNQWMPHVHADFHEQSVNSPYYFAPAAEPFHELINDWQRTFQNTLGENNARYFDEKGWSYFTKERFDLLYPSYGDTYPIFNGAIGMTYEQGGSGRAGLGVMTSAHDTLTLTDRIAHHVTTSFSTIEVSAQHAAELGRQFTQFYQQAVNNPKGAYKTFVIKKGDDPAKIKALTTLFDQHLIRYGQSKGSRSLSGYSYRNGSTGKFQLEAGDLLVSAYQPKSIFLQALFDPQVKLTDSITYDITAWALPYVFGLEAYALSSRVDAGEAGAAAAFTPAKVQENTYAYVASWRGLQDARFLAQLLKQGIRVRYALHDFSLDGNNFKAGSLIVPRTDNLDMTDFHQQVVNTANALQQPITPITTGLVSSGFDLGSGEVRFIEPPKVLLLAGDDTSPYGVGEVWHFFEQQIAYPVTIVNTGDFSGINLHDYNTVILADGRYEEILKESSLDDWIQQGGKVIALEGALAYFENNEQYGLKTYSEEEKETMEAQEKAYRQQNQLASYASRERREMNEFISGSIFRLQLDNTQPLALGYPDYYYTLKSGSARYAYLSKGWNVGTIQDTNALVSGFAGKEILSKLPESLVMGVEEKGKGQVVYMADNPLFRAFWSNGKLLFANALFLVGQE